MKIRRLCHFNEINCASFFQKPLGIKWEISKQVYRYFSSSQIPRVTYCLLKKFHHYEKYYFGNMKANYDCNHTFTWTQHNNLGHGWLFAWITCKVKINWQINLLLKFVENIGFDAEWVWHHAHGITCILLTSANCHNLASDCTWVYWLITSMHTLIWQPLCVFTCSFANNLTTSFIEKKNGTISFNKNNIKLLELMFLVLR